MSIDNAARQARYVNVDGLYVSDMNDTFNYVIRRDVNQTVNLAPLDMIMWNYKGDVTFGYFGETWEVVSYAERSVQSTTENYYSTAAKNLVEYEMCVNIDSSYNLFGGFVFNESAGNDTFCKAYGGENCTYVPNVNVCVQNSYKTTADNLIILVSHLVGVCLCKVH